MSTLTFLGVCGNQTATAETVSFLIDHDQHLVLVDAGPGVVGQIYRAGRQPADVSTVVITHAHGDHVAGFAYFVWTRFYDSLGGAEAKDLEVIAAPEIISGLQAMLAFSYNPAAFPFTVKWTEIALADPSTISSAIALRATTVDHAVPTIGLRFDLEGADDIAYSADTLYADSFVALASGAPIMIHEAFVTEAQRDLGDRTKHATALQAGQAAAAAQAEQLYLVHYFPPLESRLEELVAEARQAFDGSVAVPSVLSPIDVGS